ncbi:MAG: permease [Thermodesulfovibrionales bacterium]|nr:permease [Thermodesulfovibrionales bacterium]
MKTTNQILLIILIFLVIYNLPIENPRFTNAIYEALALTKWYAQEHVILCLIPAFFIAGAISVFISKVSVIKYFGANAHKALSYSVASVSGAILAVCSCTILPLFTSIYRRGAGLGPAIAFLYSGPAINILAIILTARILGFELGLARTIGAVFFSIVIGLLMHLIFIKEEKNREPSDEFDIDVETNPRPFYKTFLFIFSLVAILVFANWSKPSEDIGLWQLIFNYKWWITGGFLIALIFMLLKWFNKDELNEWVQSSWALALQILPLLLAGVFAAGFLLGRPEHEGIIPSSFITSLVGGNSLFANFFASFAGALMYFATLTEVPIVQGLIGSGMGKGPALALLLAGPALSLPSMLVIRAAIGFKKTLVYICLVIFFATVSGMIYGAID